jgi:hypothetical protein
MPLVANSWWASSHVCASFDFRQAQGVPLRHDDEVAAATTRAREVNTQSLSRPAPGSNVVAGEGREIEHKDKMRVVAKLITGGNTSPSWFIDLLSDWSFEVAWARHGSLGAFIEDKNSGTILLQQVLRRGTPAQAIDSKLTAVGKDERAISVSGHVFRGEVKYTEHASIRL